MTFTNSAVDVCLVFLPIIRKGAARLIPIKSTPKYMHAPNAEIVAIPALRLPRKPSHGFDLTQSLIMQVTATKADHLYQVVL